MIRKIIGVSWAIFCATAGYPAFAVETNNKPPTVRELFEACDSADQSVRTKACDRQFFAAFMASIMAISDDPNSASEEYTLCLPQSSDPHASLKLYQEELLRWLKAHPELRGTDAGQASLQGTIALYKCKR